MLAFGVTKFVVFLLCMPTVSQAGVSMVDLKCIPNLQYCQDPICTLNRTVDPANPKLSQFTFGCKLTKDVPRLTGKIKIFIKTNNKYSLVGNNMNVDIDFCKISTILTNQVLTTFVPKIAAQAATAFHACPYTGVFMVDQFTFDGLNLQSIPGWKHAKTQLAFFRGCCVPLMTVEFYTEGV